MEAGGAFDVVRQATAADIPALVEMAGRFHEQHERRFGFDADHMARHFASLIEADQFCQIHGKGFLTGVIVPALSSPDWLTAFEVLWWSEDGNGLRLMRAFEKWAAGRGAREVKFSHPVGNDRAAQILSRTGHVPAEVIYTKGIT